MFDAYTGTYYDLCNIIFYFRKLQAPRSALVCGATCGMHVFAGFVDNFFSDISDLKYAIALCLAGREIYTKCYQYIHLPFVTKLSTRHVERPSTIWRNPRQQNHSPVYYSESGPRPRHSSPKCGWRHENDFIVMGDLSTRWHMMSEEQLSILIQGRNYARGNRQIIIIPRAFACISAGAPGLWRSVMQIGKVSQEPARLRMHTTPFHGTFFSIGSS